MTRTRHVHTPSAYADLCIAHGDTAEESGEKALRYANNTRHTFAEAVDYGAQVLEIVERVEQQEEEHKRQQDQMER